MLNALGGGDCDQGATAALAGKFVTNNTPLSWGGPAGLVAASVAGGTVSIISGGKFANGAVTAAFGYLFNCLAHECLQHYREGKGTSLNANFSELGADGVGPERFKGYRDLISNEDLPDGTYKVVDKLGWQTQSLNARAAYGRVVLELTGELTVSNGQFTFTGAVSAKPDLYDFDKRPWGQRTFMGEASTRGGAMLGGKPFYNNFQGNTPVNPSGWLSPYNCCGR